MKKFINKKTVISSLIIIYITVYISGYVYYMHIKNENERIHNAYAKMVYDIYKEEIFPSVNSLEYEELKSAYEENDTEYLDSYVVYKKMGRSFVRNPRSRFYELCDKSNIRGGEIKYSMREQIENSLELISRLFDINSFTYVKEYGEDNREEIFNNLKIFHRELMMAMDKELSKGKTYVEALSLACVHTEKEGFYKGFDYYGWGK